MVKNTIPTDSRIFILEDSRTMSQQLISDLELLGFNKDNIILTEKVSDAVAQAESSKCNFIISDLNLPDGLGTTFLKFAKQSLILKNVPFMMLTTNDEVNYMIEAVKLGANEYCTKPWTQEALIEKMNYAYQQAQKVALAPPKPLNIAPKPGATISINTEKTQTKIKIPLTAKQEEELKKKTEDSKSMQLFLLAILIVVGVAAYLYYK